MIIKKLKYGLLLLAALVFHVFILDYISFWILAFLIILPLISMLITAAALDGVTAELIAKNAPLQKNEALPIQLKVYTKFFSPSCRVKIKLAIRNELLQQEETRLFFMTASHSVQTVEQIFSSEYCGMLSISIKELRIYDAIGFFSFHKKNESKCYIAVLPTLYPLMDINSGILQDVQNNTPSHIIKGTDPSEILDIREYKDGDRLSRIHWKLSNKYDQLISKDLGDIISNDVLVLFDFNGSNNEELSGLMDAVYSIFNFLLDNNITYDVEWYDSIHERLAHSAITQKSDMELELEAMLSQSRFQKQPWVLKNCNNENSHNPYSVVLYLCTEITLHSIEIIHKRLMGSQISILLVTSSPSTHKDMTVIDVNNMRESLGRILL